MRHKGPVGQNSYYATRSCRAVHATHALHEGPYAQTPLLRFVVELMNNPTCGTISANGVEAINCREKRATREAVVSRNQSVNALWRQHTERV